MTFKVALAKAVMGLRPSEPTLDKGMHLSEIVNHRAFLDASNEDKEKFLLALAEKNYQEDREKPFEHYFPGYDFEKLLAGKTVLDLGCWCGGKTVSYAEKWHPEAIYGIDVGSYFIQAARLFSTQRGPKGVRFDFRVAYGEALPYEDGAFDAIVTWDVFEHVQSVDRTLAECRRTLKPGGMLFAVFPSYYEPFGGAHLSFVSRVPCLHWIFAPKTLNAAYREIIEARGERAYWYRPNLEGGDWQALEGGIGINGTTFRRYRQAAERAGFAEVRILPTPLLSVGRMSLRRPWVKTLSNALLGPLVRIEALQDYLSHRIVSVLIA